MELPGTLFSWESLATLAGASLLTFLIVQYTKNLLDRLAHIPTDLYAVGVASLVLLAAAAGLGQPLNWNTLGLAVANGFLVAAAAGQIANKGLKPPGLHDPVEDTEAGM